MRISTSTFFAGFLYEGSTFICCGSELLVGSLDERRTEVSPCTYFHLKVYFCPTFLSLLSLVASIRPFYRVLPYRHLECEASFSPPPISPHLFPFHSPLLFNWHSMESIIHVSF